MPGAAEHSPRCRGDVHPSQVLGVPGGCGGCAGRRDRAGRQAGMCWQGPCLLPRSSCSPEQQGPCQSMGRAVFLAPHRAVMWPRCRPWQAGGFLPCPRAEPRTWDMPLALLCIISQHLKTALCSPALPPSSSAHSEVLGPFTGGEDGDDAFLPPLPAFCMLLVAEELMWLPCVPWLSPSLAAAQLVMTRWRWLPAPAPSRSAASWEPSRPLFPDVRGLASGNFRAQSCSHVENIFPAIRHPSKPDAGRVSLHQHVPCHGLWPRAPSVHHHCSQQQLHVQETSRVGAA